LPERGPLAQGPFRFLRLTQTRGRVDAEIYFWWIGSLGPYEPPASVPRRCTEAREGAPACIASVPLNRQRDWQSVLRKVLMADGCKAARATDAYELRAQIFEREPYPRHRDSEFCDAVALEFMALFEAVAPSEFRRR
jgi:hypothetical protein